MPRTARRRLVLSASIVLGCGALTAFLWSSVFRSRIPEGTPQDVKAEHRWLPKAKSDRWSCIVIHHSGSTAGGADRFDDWHRNKGWDELGYHFVVGNGTDTADGQVEVGPRWVAQKHGAHCMTPDDYYNQHGIGVCLVGNFDLAAPDERQMQSLRRLLVFLCREFRIEPDFIYTHGVITGETRCPGKHFDVEKLRRQIESAATQPGDQT
jgi:hypothetical protein